MEIVQNQLESVSRLQTSLSATGIQSVVIGGIAVAVWGDPRVTKDADLKVLLTREQAKQLLDALPSEYQIISSDPEGDLRELGFIFIKDSNGVRIDLLLSDLGFDQQAVERGREIEPLPGLRMVVCAPEDLVIYKLISTRAYDHEDARKVVARQARKLDHDYIEDWLRQFEIALDDSTLVQSYRKMIIA
jgi:hypothetical protein